MKYLYSLLLLSTIAIASDDCTLNPESIKGAIDKKSAQVKKYSTGKIVNLTFEETAHLKDGMIVTYRYGGCHYQGISWELLNFGKLPVGDKSKLIDFLSTKLNSVPVTYAYAKSVFTMALKEEKTKPGKFTGPRMDLSCGEGSTCFVDVESNRIYFGYDFAL